MLDICDVREEWLPGLYESSEKTGTLKADVACELGFPKDCIVAAGAGDNAAAAIGTGTVGAGKCNLSLGTSGTLFITSDEFRVDSHNALHSFDHADGGYHLMGCMLSAASCNNWWMKDILHSDDFVNEQKPLEEDGRLGENHVYFLPYLMGERSPHNDPSARAAFIGMSMDTDRATCCRLCLRVWHMVFEIHLRWQRAWCGTKKHNNLWWRCKEWALEKDSCKRHEYAG